MTEQKPGLARLVVETLVFAALIPPTFAALKLTQLVTWWRDRKNRSRACADVRPGELVVQCECGGVRPWDLPHGGRRSSLRP